MVFASMKPIVIDRVRENDSNDPDINETYDEYS